MNTPKLGDKFVLTGKSNLTLAWFGNHTSQSLDFAQTNIFSPKFKISEVDLVFFLTRILKDLKQGVGVGVGGGGGFFHFLLVPFERVSGFSGMEWWNGGMVEWIHVLHQVHFWQELHQSRAVSIQWNGLLEWTTGMDYWNGLLEWTTGMPFDLKFNHKTPIIEPIRGVRVRELCLQSAHSLHVQTSKCVNDAWAPFSPNRSAIKVAEKFALLLVWLESISQL